MRIALVDDSEIERGILLSLITDYGCEKQILFESDCFDSGDAFLSSFSSDKYDIVFMDIFMNGMSGVETASKMRQIDSHVILIFLTASADYMPDAFRVHAFHYILKPYQKDAIFACLNDASLHLPASETFISFSVNAIEVRIFASQIVCIVADSHYTWITDRNGQKYHPCAAFGTFSKQLLSDRHFLLVSRGVLCNMDDITAFLLQFSKAFFFQQCAVVDNSNIVSQQRNLRKNVTGNQNSFSSCVAKLPNKGAYFCNTDRIETVDRFIQNQKFWIVHNGKGDGKPLLHTKRIL